MRGHSHSHVETAVGDALLHRALAPSRRAAREGSGVSVLFIGPLPDPVTGQSLACQVFLDELSKTHTVDVINLSKKGYESGADSFGRVKEVLAFAWQAWRKSGKADIIYFTISESLAGNLKDILLYCACFPSLGSMVIHLHGGAGMRELMRADRKLLRKLNGFFLKRLGAVIVLGERHVDLFSDLVQGGCGPDHGEIVISARWNAA